MAEKHVIDLLVDNIGSLYTMAPAEEGSRVRRGAQLREVGLIHDAAVAAREGRIVAVGPTDTVRAGTRLLAGSDYIDADGAAVIPGLVDPHTHAVFGRPRSEEFGRRLLGESYQSIATAGGGIRASVRDFRSLDEEELFRRSRRRLRSAVRYGSTTIEVKSGYGLDLENELKALRVIRRLAAEAGIGELVATCLAAHEIPDDRRDDREGFLREVCEQVLPTVVEEGLAERVDVFCEPGVFSVAESRRVLEAAQALGLRATLHADELEGSGGAELAASVGADSADHLGRISDAGIAALANSETVGVLLPGTIFSLGLETWAPARRMIEAGVALALATDFNPGSNYCESLPLTMVIACTRMGLHPHEALSMCTINAAAALNRSAEIGSLEASKRCDLVLLRSESVEILCHHMGLDEIELVVASGRILYDRSRGNPS